MNNGDSTRTLLLLDVLLVLGHSLSVVWHLTIFDKLYPGPRAGEIELIASMATVVPAVALFLLWMGFRRVSGSLLLLFFLTTLTIGVDEHFVANGKGNILHIAAGPWVPAFRMSVALLLAFEILGCWASVLILSKPELPNASAWI